MLDKYRERADHVRGRPRNRKERKQLESPQLIQDAYVGRPFTKQQRMRHGTLPVLERNADVTIDTMGAHLYLMSSYRVHAPDDCAPGLKGNCASVFVAQADSQSPELQHISCYQK